ncbi:MAG TPA: PBP1A family penicillin-binding protein [Acetobacteraceae bacterium]|nr:PBP1A family penicillin-binding protein [Acetobacteraceae bacterium]
MARVPRSVPPARLAPRARVAAPLRRPPAAATLPAVSPSPVAAISTRRHRFRLLRWAIITTIWGALALALVVLWFARDLPRPDSALDATRRPSLTLEDRTGRVFARFGDVVGEPLHLSDMPPYLPEAVVAVEDRRYWHHSGIDLIGMARAAWADLRAGRVVQGGSTLTQQVAKNLFLSNARTLSRKVQELLLTLWLEQHFSKRQILEIYLDRVYLGAGAWGVDAAAHVYFGVSARHVTLWQAAVLAGLPQAPSRFNPRVNPSAATARAKQVLAAMVETGAITGAQARAAAAQIAFPPAPAIAAGWFADWAAAQAGPELSPNADATLRTTLDARLQAVAESRLSALLDGPGAAAGVSQGAVVVVDAATGAVRAMVGGRDYRSGSFNRAVEARRQPGSAFKPFTWLSVLRKGLTPESTVLDAPIRIGRWSPEDYDRRYQGEVTLTEALAQSINTAAVRLLLRAGGPRVVAATAARLGIADALPDDASLALGTGEVGLLELSASYAPFFNRGYRITPYGVAGYAAAHPPVPVIGPEHAAMMARMLTAVVTSGTGRAAAVTGHEVAGKTGTTQDFRDAWFIGCIGGTIIGVWLGNDDDRPMRGVMGGGLPARLFHEIAVTVR